MKTKLLQIVFLLTCLGIGMDQAKAQGGGAGVRGGGSLLKIEQSYSLREIFLLQGSGDRLKVSGELISLLKEIRLLVEDYTGAKLTRFWSEVYGGYSDYRLVKKLPCLKQNDVAPESLGKGGSYVGCTVNGVTYFDRSLFAGLNTPQKIMSMLHERAHVFDMGEKAHDWIYPFVQGVYTLVTLKLEQEKGIHRILEPYEIRALTNLLENEKIYLHLKEKRSIVEGYRAVTPYGGGKLFFDSENDALQLIMDTRSFVSVDSRVDFSKRRCGLNEAGQKSLRPVLRQSEVIHSWVTCSNLDQSSVRDSKITFLPLYQSSLPWVKQSTFKRSNLQMVGKRIRIIQSHFEDTFLVNDMVDQQVEIENSSYLRSKIDYTGFSRDWTQDGIYPVPVSRVQVLARQRKVINGLNEKTRVPEGFSLSINREKAPLGQVQLKNQMGNRVH